MSEVEEFETKDIFLASYLVDHLDLLGIRREDSGSPRKKPICFFRFKRCGSIVDLKGKFFSGKAMVSALRYVDNYKNLRTLMETGIDDLS